MSAMHVCAVESVKCSVDTPSPEHWTPRTPPLSLPKVMTDAWSGVWAGASTSRAQAAEEALFKRHIKSPWHLGRVAIDLPDLGLGTQYINTLEVNPSCTDVPPIVLTHGAGSGMAFFYKNIEALANLNGVRRRLLVFDWLGQAGSSRPSFPYGAFADKPSWMLSEDAKIDAAIRFATEALEAWCRAMGLTQFELLAHSMGGYLATQYAMAYPERVRHLVLISPVGWAARPTGELASARASGVFGALWESGLGNFGFGRVVGRVARVPMQSVMLNRLNITDETDARDMAEYFWNSLCAQPISGEKNVNWLLVPYLPPAPFGFYARRPVCTEPAERLARLPPTTLIYGSHDLHYIPTMPEAIEKVRAASTEPVRMLYVRNADHHLYVDNPVDFHREVAAALA